MSGSVDRPSAEERAMSPLERLWRQHPSDRFSFEELIEPPTPRNFIVGWWIPEGVACGMMGAGATSKTGLLSKMSIAVATGGEFFGHTAQQGNVLIVSAEDRRDTMHRHIYVNTQHLSEDDRRMVSNHLYMKDVVGLGFKLSRRIDGQVITSPDVGQLIEYASEVGGFKLIAFDTLSRLNGGDEDNEGLARFVEAMETVSRETGAATLVLHHTGKAQARAGLADQYGSRGGSALPDNLRSVMHLERVDAKTQGAPSNAAEIIADGRLVRLSHTKFNYSPQEPDRYLERKPTAHAAFLAEFDPEFGSDDIGTVWKRVAAWMRENTQVPYPTKDTLVNLGIAYGSRAQLRAAIQWADDRGMVIEAPHPEPRGARKSYLRLPPSLEAHADAYRKAKGE